MIDTDARDRILKRMLEGGGVGAHVAVLLSVGLDDDGAWHADQVNRYLALLNDQRVSEYSAEILKLATTADYNVDTWGTIDMIDAALETYSQRDIEPLRKWLSQYASELDR